MVYKILNSFILTVCVFCSCFSQKSNWKWKAYPNLEIKIIHEWEKIIEETSIENSSVNMETKEVGRTISKAEKNTFILHYKIATVKCTTIFFEDSSQTKREFKGYSLLYDKEGNLIEIDEGFYKRFYYYTAKGEIDSTSLLISVMGGVIEKPQFVVAKDLKRWDKVKGKTGFTRLIERELHSAVYYKKQKVEYSFLAKLQYSYFKDGLLAGIKSFDEEGNLKLQEKFTYTFYQ